MTVRTIPWAFCPRCHRSVMVLRDPRGVEVAVDPEPIAGGPLIVNGAAARIIGVIPASGAGSGEVGWRRHTALCPRATSPIMVRGGLFAPDRRVTA
jgi:hypothetical protein